jgi:hypothetical protein
MSDVTRLLEQNRAWPGDGLLRDLEVSRNGAAP